MRLRARAYWLCCVALLVGLPGTAFSFTPPAEREKTDVVTLANGDRLTGRILYVQFGILQLSSKHSGSVAIEWPSVRSISSRYAFRVERFGGSFAAGLLTTSADGTQLLVTSATASQVTIPMAEVSRMLPYDENFWHRIDGSASIGYNYTRSSGVSQLSGAFSSHYASETIEAQLAAHAIASRDPSGTTNQDQLISSVFFLRDTRNFWGFLGELESNQSLGIDSRILGGPLVGRRMYQSETAEFTGLAGVVYDEEQPHGAFASQGSAEGMLVGQWRIYKFIYPKVSLDMSVLAFPSISDSPRFRAGANVALTLKVTDRFALSLSEYGNYDSKPPGESTGTYDYGITASLTYNFGYVIP